MKNKLTLDNDDLLPEYDVDYSEAKPNHFAARRGRTNVVVLDEDVAQVFKTPEEVNRILRALIQNLPALSAATK